jgi:phage baseplate assembly protein W
VSFETQVEMDLPFGVDPQGRIAFTTDPRQVLRNRVLSIIGTGIGERVMRPEYGTPLADMLFEGDDEVTTSIIIDDIRRAIEEYEPGVLIQDVFPTTTDGLDGIINLNVTYSAANSPLETVSVPVNTAVLYRGGVVEEERSG